MSNPSSTDDLRLLRQVANGDDRSLKVLVQRHQGLVVRLCQGILQSREDAEEVASWAFVKLWQAAPRFRGDCSVKAYLCRIAINLSRDRYDPRPIPNLECDEHAPALDPRWEQIEIALRSLNPDDRELLTLFYLEDLDYAEIETILGVSHSVLKTRLVRARTRLRTALGLNDECRKA